MQDDVGSPIWTGFIFVVLFLLFIDLLMLRRESKPITMRSALGWTAFWISMGVAMNLAVLFHMGRHHAVEFTASYMLEESLSVDNLFVFLLIFNYFKVPAEYQHRVLFLGVLGALILRFTFIIAGLELIEVFKPFMYVLGLVLVVSGLKLFSEDDDDLDPEQNWVVRKARKLFPITKEYHGNKIFVRLDGVLHATPLFIVLVAIETTDLIFAVDSIPAVFGITQNHFIVYSSNVMAILGLRAVYFALSGMMKLFRFLRFGLAGVLIFIGAKMLIEPWLHIGTVHALTTIGVMLALALSASLLIPEKPPDEEEDPPASS